MDEGFLSLLRTATPSPHLIYIFFSVFFFHFLNDSIEKSTVFDRMDEGFLSLLRTATPSPDSLRYSNRNADEDWFRRCFQHLMRSWATTLRTPLIRTCDCRTLHLTLIVDDDSSIILEIKEGAVFSPKCLPLTDDDSRHDLLPKFWFALFDCCQDHVTICSGGKTIKTASDTTDGDDVQIFGSSIVGAVDDCSYWETQGNAKFGSCGSSTSSFRHLGCWEKAGRTSSKISLRPVSVVAE